MRYVDEFRDGAAVRKLISAIERVVTRPWAVMEICGGQTHAIVKYGLDTLLPQAVSLIHGPGCPVCVTPVDVIDRAIDLAGRPGVTLCSFGDMLRVPGSRTDLLACKASGGDVRMVYSPLDAVELARKEPKRDVVFLAVGFETTAPATAAAIVRAEAWGLDNFFVLPAHVRVPPAMAAILGAPDNRVQGFLAAGHVCTVMGYADYEPLAAQFRVPIVVTGFEPVDILQGLHACLRQLESGDYRVENQYARVVSRAGNPAARALIERVFEPVSQRWRGMGELPDSGLGLNPNYRRFDSDTRFPGWQAQNRESDLCLAGEILRGVRKPFECPAFGRACTPDKPLGAPMVSSEGACAAYFRYRHAEQFPV